MIGDETIMPKCPKCGSENVEKMGSPHEAGMAGAERKLTPLRKLLVYKCEDCGEHFSAPVS